MNKPNQCEANARLIDKAPEMAELLQTFVTAAAIDRDLHPAWQGIVDEARRILKELEES